MTVRSNAPLSGYFSYTMDNMSLLQEAGLILKLLQAEVKLLRLLINVTKQIFNVNVYVTVITGLNCTVYVAIDSLSKANSRFLFKNNCAKI